jgi:hypothetical protein
VRDNSTTVVVKALAVRRAVANSDVTKWNRMNDEDNEMAMMLGEIEALAADDDREILSVIESAQALLQQSDATLARVERGDDVHTALAGHFDALSDVAALLANMEASAPALDDASAQLEAFEAKLGIEDDDDDDDGGEIEKNKQIFRG